MNNTDNVKTETPRADGGPLPDDAAWSYRGYRLKPSEFNTAMVHFYRGEVQRANTWRNRLDTTTNWAIITAGTAISFSLSDPAHHHGVLLLNIGLLFIFLFIEARRYRYFELWSYRIRLLETDFFAAMLVPPFHPSADWAEALASSLLRPKFPISNWEALGRRFRRNYFAIFAALILVWLFKNYTQPTAAASWSEFVERARVGLIPGEFVMVSFAIFTLAMIVMGLFTAALQDAPGEVLPYYQVLERLRLTRKRKPRFAPGAQPATASSKRPVWNRPHVRREEYLTMIISEKSSAIAAKVMVDLGRGVTALHGEGMYTQKPREVLICALTETEIEPLKQAVRSVDPSGFVVVMPATEVTGRGFMPFGDEEE
jgi:uncharacterized membrane protein